MTKKDIKVGGIYRIKCGWGWTKSKLEYVVEWQGKTVYHWKQTSSDFRFITYDLNDTVEA